MMQHAHTIGIVQQILSVACSVLPIGYIIGLLGGANKKNTNDNSSGVLTLLNIMEQLKDLPQDAKSKVCFVFTDNEEKGLFGSTAFKNKYKKVLHNQKIINFDCVGLGTQINAYYVGSPEGNTVIDEVSKLINSDTNTVVPKRSTMMSMSDHIPFVEYNHTTLLCVDKDNQNSLYSQIHSANDTVLDESNIDFLSGTYSQKVRSVVLNKSNSPQVHTLAIPEPVRVLAKKKALSFEV